MIHLTNTTDDNYEENLKSGEDLFFVSSVRISKYKWFRSPLMNKTQSINLFLDLMNDPDHKDVNVQSENTLNKYKKRFDENKGEWVNTHITLREQQFGARYQDDYEFYCKECGVNLDKIKEVQSARAEYVNLVAGSKVEQHQLNSELNTNQYHGVFFSNRHEKSGLTKGQS